MVQLRHELRDVTDGAGREEDSQLCRTGRSRARVVGEAAERIEIFE